MHEEIQSAKNFSLADLDEELKQLTQMAPVVLAQRNACVPISYLPVEVLLHTLMLSSLKEPEDDRLFPRTKARRWIVASHVCKRWREIVLDHATAWAEHVFSFSEEYVQSIILKRAGTAPLTFRYYDREQNEDEERRFNLVLQHIHQIARLDVLLFQPTRATTLFQALCSNSLPVLEELVIDYAPPSMDNPLFFFWTGPSFVAPQLRKCTLVDCYLQSWNVPSLEDLELRTARGRKSPGFPSFAQFLKSLRSSPNLRRLRTSSYIPSADAELHHPVHLPLLEKMDITDSTLDRIPALLSYLRLPSSCRANLAYDNGGWRFRRTIPPDHPPSSRPTHLSISADQDTLTISVQDHILERLRFIECTLSDTDLMRLCGLLADTFHLNQISTLSLGLQINHDDALWREIVTAFPEVRSVHLHHEGEIHQGLHVLRAHPTLQNNPSALVIPRIDFVTSLSHEDNPTASLATLVYDMLSSRAAVGSRLKTLEIDRLIPNLEDDDGQPEEQIRKMAPVEAFLARLMSVVEELRWRSVSNRTISSFTSPMELPFSFGHRNSVTEKLTPLSAPGAIYDGKSYPTAQHLFEAAKFLPHRPDIAEAILETRNAHEAVNVSAREKQAIREDWAQIAQEKADEVLYHKFVQNEGARRTLLRTGNMKLVCKHPDR